MYSTVTSYVVNNKPEDNGKKLKQLKEVNIEEDRTEYQHRNRESEKTGGL